MNEMKQLQMRLTSDNKLVCDSNPTVIFCDGKYPHKDKPVLTFEQRDVVYLTDYEGWTSQYEEAMKIVKICNDKLTNATEAVNKILKDNGSLEDFTISE